jgi:hypothetical protein
LIAGRPQKRVRPPLSPGANECKTVEGVIDVEPVACARRAGGALAAVIGQRFGRRIGTIAFDRRAMRSRLSTAVPRGIALFLQRQ